MKRARYSVLFAALTLGHTVVALASYRAISSLAGGASRDDSTQRWPDDTLPPSATATGIRPADVDSMFARIAAGDSAWRRQYARVYSIAELRVRGDGRRTPRQAMQDRVYKLTRVGNRDAAIQELRRWVRANGRDADAMLWLARLLHEEGRSGEAVPLYRRAIALEGGSAGER
ncbi:MAG: hypothetical protein ACRENU_12030 [Gemmatimonadaceae bacterium]